MELLLVRHAEPFRVDAGDVEGPADPGLSDRGLAQAARLATWLAGESVDVVVSSPLRRARETAAAVAAATRLDAVVHAGIAEYDATSDEYIPFEELRAAKDERWYATIEGRWADVGGVDPREFQGQVVPAVDALIDRYPGARVALIAHAGVINVYLAHVMGLERLLWFHPEYASISRVLAARGGVRSVASVNETAHLVATRDATTPRGKEVAR